MSNFRKARKKAGLSQKEIAIILKVAPPTVSNWERGERTPAGKHLLKLTSILNCSIDYLLGNSDNPNLPTNQTTENINLEYVLAKEGVTKKEDIKTIKRLIEMMALTNDDTDYAGDDFIAKDYNRKQSG